MILYKSAIIHVIENQNEAYWSWDKHIYWLWCSKQWKDSKFEVGDYAKMSNCVNTFAKVHTPYWCEEDFMNKTIKNILPCT